MLKLSLTNRQKGLCAAALTATCWSFLAIFLKLALTHGDAYSIVWYRMMVATLALGSWLFFSGKKKDFVVFKTKPGILFIAALCLAANYLGFMQGVSYTSPSNAQVFIQLGPLMLAVSGVLFFNEKLSLIQFLGFLMCICGFYLFFLDKSESFMGTPSQYYIGQAWIFFAAITWAVFASLQKKLFKTWSSSQINLYIYFIATMVFTLFVDWGTLSQISLSTHLLFIFLGLNTLLAYGCLSIALKHLPATQVSPIITMNPLFTMIFLVILETTAWNIIPPDPIRARGYIGAILAVAGVILVLRQKK